MSEDERYRPRRAWDSDDDAAASPPDSDDTSGHDLFRPRRGSAPEVEALTPIPPPVFPRSAGEFAESPSPAPRRSALSSSSPPETAPVKTSRVPGALRGSLARWAIGGVAGALVVGSVAFFATRGPVQPDGAPTAPVSPSASASPSPGITEVQLISGADLAGIAPADSWAVTATSTTAADHEGRVACLSTENPVHNPTTSLQRTLATSDEDQLAALHRIDVYASPAAAEQMFADRSAALSGCAEVPARIVSSSTVSGLGDKAFQITVAFENQPAQYHTILITLAGSSLQMLDVARTSGPLQPELLTASVARSQTALCDAEDLACAAAPEVAAAVVPAVEPLGWLIPSDLPRVRAGAGRWTASEPADLTSQGMGCENMTLVSEPGPTSRQQATYLLTQDDQAPATFGVDVMQFTFPDATTARAFAVKLGTALVSCKDRVNTATVAEIPAVTGTGADGVAVSSRLFSIRQATAATTSVPYQLAVSIAGPKVVYTIVTVTDAYKFSDAQLTELGLRIPVRATQS